MHGGYSDDLNQSTFKNNKYKERSGLIPITSKIFNNLEVRTDDTLEYKGTPVCDIVIVGFITDYNEGEIVIKLKVWDGTGSINAEFFNKNESESHPGLVGFKFDGNKRLVRLFGHCKVFKKDKQFSGNKIFYTDDKDFQMHRYEVIYSWLFLTGKINNAKSRETLNNSDKKSEKNYSLENSSVKANNQSNNNNFKNSNTTNQQNIVFDHIKELSKNNKKVLITDLVIKLDTKISKDKVLDIIQNLCNNGYLLEEGGMIRII